MRVPNPFWLVVTASIVSFAALAHRPAHAGHVEPSERICQAYGNLTAAVLVLRVTQSPDEIRKAFNHAAQELTPAVANTLRQSLEFGLSLPSDTPPQDAGRWAYYGCLATV